MKLYPAWRYHKELEAKIIEDESQEHPEWHDNPAKVNQEVIKKEQIEEPKEEKKKSKKAKE